MPRAPAVLACAALACAAVLALLGAPPATSGAQAAVPGSAPVRSPGGADSSARAVSPSAGSSESLTPVAPSDVPPAGRRLSANRVLAIADELPKMRAVRAKHPGSYPSAYLKGRFLWQVSYFSRTSKEIGQVIIADLSGRVLEQWTGFQVAWNMARGYPGAFGRHVNALYIWLPLCVLFMLPFFDFRRPLSLLHLDLLVLLSFSVSLAFFNHAHIYASVPLAYPPLVYLLARMLALARPGGRARELPASGLDASAALGGGPGLGPGGSRRGSLHLLVPARWLALGAVFLVGFRIGLNVADSNVIDVGYAGVIGAQRIVHGKPLYGAYPSDNEHGDTYGPVTYEAYVPFVQLFGWSGRWDQLPAAHAAAIAFDLMAVALLFLLGRRVRGPTLGIALAYAWVSYPFTLFALESNSNDTLVAVLVLGALLAASSAPARGAFAALAGLAKFAPLALAPLLATHGARARLEPSGNGSQPPPLAPRARARVPSAFIVAFLVVAVLVSIPALSHDSLHAIYERTIAYQAGRGSPFSVWGLYGGLGGVELVVQVAAVLLALALAVAPRRPDLIGLAAACAAVLIALQVGVQHWFYLYIPWFFAPLILALFGARARGEVRAGTEPAARRELARWAPSPA